MSDTFAVRRWLLLFALCVAASTAVARDFKVDPGDVPELREGEGYLVIAVDSDSRVRSLAIRSDDRAFASGRLYGIREGSTMGLYVLPAGTYRWNPCMSVRLRGRCERIPRHASPSKPAGSTTPGTWCIANRT